MYVTIQTFSKTEFLGRVGEVRLEPDTLEVTMTDGSKRLYMSRLVIGMTILDGEIRSHEVF